MISINNRGYVGQQINITNGKITIDGIDVTPEEKEINISVTGNIEKLKIDTCSEITINGDVENLNTLSGDVMVAGNVTGYIKTMSGDVKCGTVAGPVTTMSGDIKHTKQ